MVLKRDYNRLLPAANRYDALEYLICNRAASWGRFKTYWVKNDQSGKINIRESNTTARKIFALHVCNHSLPIDDCITTMWNDQIWVFDSKMNSSQEPMSYSPLSLQNVKHHDKLGEGNHTLILCNSICNSIIFIHFPSKKMAMNWLPET